MVNDGKTDLKKVDLSSYSTVMKSCAQLAFPGGKGQMREFEAMKK